MKDGKPDLSAPAPRLNGKPDLSGLWQAEKTPEREYERVLGQGFTSLQIDTDDITKDAVNVFWGIKPEDEPLSAGGCFDPQAPYGEPDGVSPHSVPSWRHTARNAGFHLQDDSNAAGDRDAV